MVNLGASLLLCVVLCSEALELRKVCFRQARVAQAVLPTGALFHPETFAFPPCPPPPRPLVPPPTFEAFRFVEGGR